MARDGTTTITPPTRCEPALRNVSRARTHHAVVGPSALPQRSQRGALSTRVQARLALQTRYNPWERLCLSCPDHLSHAKRLGESTSAHDWLQVRMQTNGHGGAVANVCCRTAQVPVTHAQLGVGPVLQRPHDLVSSTIPLPLGDSIYKRSKRARSKLPETSQRRRTWAGGHYRWHHMRHALPQRVRRSAPSRGR
jgi:hypothetical protein